MCTIARTQGTSCVDVLDALTIKNLRVYLSAGGIEEQSISKMDPRLVEYAAESAVGEIQAPWDTLLQGEVQSCADLKALSLCSLVADKCPATCCGELGCSPCAARAVVGEIKNNEHRLAPSASTAAEMEKIYELSKKWCVDTLPPTLANLSSGNLSTCEEAFSSDMCFSKTVQSLCPDSCCQQTGCPCNAIHATIHQVDASEKLPETLAADDLPKESSDNDELTDTLADRDAPENALMLTQENFWWRRRRAPARCKCCCSCIKGCKGVVSFWDVVACCGWDTVANGWWGRRLLLSAPRHQDGIGISSREVQKYVELAHSDNSSDALMLADLLQASTNLAESRKSTTKFHKHSHSHSHSHGDDLLSLVQVQGLCVLYWRRTD